MTVGWNIWLALANFAAITLVLTTEGVVRLRTSYGKRWHAISIFSLAMLFCLSGTIVSYLMFTSTDKLLNTIKNPPGPSHLDASWGADVAKDVRMKNSEILASISFVNWGIRVNYFDMNGALVPYQPSDADHENLRLRKEVIAKGERSSTLLMWATLGWLFVPWIGLAMAFMPWSIRMTAALTGRSKSDALPAGRAPLS